MIRKNNMNEENEITEEEVLFFLAKHDIDDADPCESAASACSSGETCGGSPGEFVRVLDGPNQGDCWCECGSPPPPCCEPCTPCPPPPPSPPVNCCCCPEDYGFHSVEGEITYQSDGMNLMNADFAELSTSSHALQFATTVYLPPENLTENILKLNWNMSESTITNSFLVSYNGTIESVPPGYLFVNWNSNNPVGSSIKIEYSTDNTEWFGWLILDMAGDQVGKVFFMLPKINGQFLTDDYYFRVNYTASASAQGDISIKYSYNQLSSLKQSEKVEQKNITNEIWTSQYYRPSTSKFKIDNFALSFNNDTSVQNLVKGPDIRIIKDIDNE